ncbi:MAG: thymidylate synthase [Chloroflexi bacterium]|nr:thymidylate synthase [Chloroflexota bacterium]
MNSFDIVTIRDSDLSLAWARAYKCLLDRKPKKGYRPMAVSVDIDESGIPVETPAIRNVVEAELASCNEYGIETVANTIFPLSMWNKNLPKEELFNRYLRTVHRLLKFRGNNKGIYFQRMISFGKDNPKNQLDHIIGIWKKGNHRKSALQMAIFDPATDHVSNRQLGFPCLQQVSLNPIGTNGADGLVITGLYPKQLWSSKGYGNLLGLIRLGAFMATEMNLTLSRAEVISLSPDLHGASRSLSNFINNYPFEDQ